jgi:pyruvate formate lyase activating enzyme
VYGNPCAIHTDPIEKKPIYHMLPGSMSFSIATAGCNLHCKYCQNWEISQSIPEETNNTDMPPEKVVELALKSGCDTISYTYTDPVVYYEYALDTSKLAKEKGLRNILVTAGYINTEPLFELCKYIDAAHIDLKGFTEDFYANVCSGTLQPVLNTIQTMHEEGVWIELINLIIPTLNDDFIKIEEMCKWIKSNIGPDVPLHFSRFYPMYKLKNLPLTPEETLTQARDIALKTGLNYVYVGNIPGHPGENTFCPQCKKIVIGRIGYSIREKNILNGNCKFCGHKIPGIWK